MNQKTMIRERRARAGAATALMGLLGGCVTNAEFLAQNTAPALRAAEARGGFELNCADAQPTILTQKIIQGVQGGYGRRNMGAWAGPWTEYTIGVRGCGKEAVYRVVCRDEDSCNAFSQTARALDSPN